jgi:hypothetical protein
MKGVNSTMVYLIYCKNFVNVTMYPQTIAATKDTVHNSVDSFALS